MITVPLRQITALNIPKANLYRPIMYFKLMYIMLEKAVKMELHLNQILLNILL
jgi:hypothetical protein